MTKHEVEPRTLVLHADRGAPMISKSLAQLLADLDVTRSFRRPHTSNNNPFSESQFRTAKYHASYSGRFPALEDALAWGTRILAPAQRDRLPHPRGRLLSACPSGARAAPPGAARRLCPAPGAFPERSAAAPDPRAGDVHQSAANGRTHSRAGHVVAANHGRHRHRRLRATRAR